MLKFFQNILTKYKSHRNDQLMTSIYTGNQAVMNRFGRDIYLSDLVNNCINRIAKVWCASMLAFFAIFLPVRQ